MTDAMHMDDRASAVVVIAMSAGALSPVRRLVRGLSSGFRPAIVIAHHVQSVTVLPEILQGDTARPVVLASAGCELRPGTIYVSPAQTHVIVNPDATLSVSHRGRIRFFRPNSDWLFESAAASFEQQTTAVVLSGLQNDGARGAQCVRAAGGTVIAQDPETCERPEMPLAAIATGAVRYILPPGAIGPMLETIAARMGVGGN